MHVKYNIIIVLSFLIGHHYYLTFPSSDITWGLTSYHLFISNPRCFTIMECLFTPVFISRNGMSLFLLKAKVCFYFVTNKCVKLIYEYNTFMLNNIFLVIIGLSFVIGHDYYRTFSSSYISWGLTSYHLFISNLRCFRIMECLSTPVFIFCYKLVRQVNVRV